MVIQAKLEAKKYTFCGDTRISITEGIKSQLSPRSRATVGQKTKRVGTTKDVDEGRSKRSKNARFGIYTSARGTQILNPGIASQRILQSGTTYKDVSSIGIDVSYKPRGLKWKNKDAVTTNQLQ
ncbi:hypothetical protein P3S67_004690 [Capsicum chacoense]